MRNQGRLASFCFLAVIWLVGVGIILYVFPQLNESFIRALAAGMAAAFLWEAVFFLGRWLKGY